MTRAQLPTYFLSHGGGPWPWLKAERGSRKWTILTNTATKNTARGGPMPGKGKWVPARSGMNSVLDAMGNYPFGMDSCAR
jgi:hypothetical protein